MAKDFFEPITDLKNARILLVNDDGVNGEGIKLLEEIVKELCDDVWVVAPDENQSGTGQSITLNEPLAIKQTGEKHFAVRGTPTDCTLAGCHLILKDKEPDLVISGINKGSNLGSDINYSGTLAAANEATVLEYRTIAFSQGNDPMKFGVSWEVAKKYTADFIKELVSKRLPANVLMNVNFPALENADDVKGVVAAPQGGHMWTDELEEFKDPLGRSYAWIVGRQPKVASFDKGDDVAYYNNGYITITPITINRTDKETMKDVQEWVANFKTK